MEITNEMLKYIKDGLSPEQKEDLVAFSAVENVGDLYSTDLHVILWKDGSVTYNEKRKEEGYMPEAYKDIQAIVSCHRYSLYDHYGTEVAYLSAMTSEEMREDAMEQYIDEYTIDDILPKANEDALVYVCKNNESPTKS